MSIAKKHKRKLIYQNHTYYWWIKRDDDYDRPILHIASEDKRLIVLYPMGQEAGQRYVVSIGREFKGCGEGGCWHRYRVPELSSMKTADSDQSYENAAESVTQDFPVTPGFVSSLLRWCLQAGDAEPVVWNGKNIWL